MAYLPTHLQLPARPQVLESQYFDEVKEWRPVGAGIVSVGCGGGGPGGVASASGPLSRGSNTQSSAFWKSSLDPPLPPQPVSKESLKQEATAATGATLPVLSAAPSMGRRPDYTRARSRGRPSAHFAAISSSPPDRMSVQRGPRLRTGLHAGWAKADVSVATGRMTYRGQVGGVVLISGLFCILAVFLQGFSAVLAATTRMGIPL